MTPIRAGARASAVVVGLIAAIASYTHMRDLAAVHGQTILIANLMPVSVDGMILCGTLSLADGRRYRSTAWAAVILGAAASVVANVLAAPPDVLSRCISAWPAVALIVVVEVLARSGREAKAQTFSPAPLAAQTSPVVSDIVSDTPTPEIKPRAPRKPLTTEQRVARAVKRMPDAAVSDIAGRLGLSERTVHRYLPRPINGVPVLAEVDAP